MATDAQQSGPLPGQKFTLGRWRQTFGHDPAIVGDVDGSAFGLTLPPSTDVAEVGSATVESVVIVGGHPLIIPAGQTQSIEIPASENSTVGRTDIIAAKWDPATFNTAPGPVRLVRIEGTEGSTDLPAYIPPLVRPLWAVTRRAGKSLNEAARRDLRAWSGRNYLVKVDEPLPKDAPLGSTASRGGTLWRRDLVGSTVDWVITLRPPERVTGTAALAQFFANWQGQASCLMVRDHDTGQRTLTIVVRRTTVLQASAWGNLDEVRIARVFNADSPTVQMPMSAIARTNTPAGPVALAGVHMDANGNIYLNSLLPNAVIGPSGPSDTITATATWFVAPSA